MKKNTLLILGVAVVIVACIIAATYIVISTPSAMGWADNKTLTDKFLAEEDVGVGCDWNVMSDGTTAGMTKVRLYSRVVYPGADWVLQREGLVDIDNNFYWHTYH